MELKEFVERIERVWLRKLDRIHDFKIEIRWRRMLKARVRTRPRPLDFESMHTWLDLIGPSH